MWPCIFHNRGDFFCLKNGSQSSTLSGLCMKIYFLKVFILKMPNDDWISGPDMAMWRDSSPCFVSQSTLVSRWSKCLSCSSPPDILGSESTHSVRAPSTWTITLRERERERVELSGASTTRLFLKDLTLQVRMSNFFQPLMLHLWV